MNLKAKVKSLKVLIRQRSMILEPPQKKSSKMEMYSDSTSGKLFNVDEDTQSRRTWDSIQSKPTTSAKLVSKPASKQTATSLVDMILM